MAQDPDQKLRVGDTYPGFTSVLSLSDGTILDLTGQTIPVAWIKKPGEGAFSAAPGTVVVDVDPTTGRVTYPWQAADTGVAGDIALVFKGDIDGDVYTAPPVGSHLILVSEL